MIPDYPETKALLLKDRALMEPLFKRLLCGISEFTFANLFLFRHTHNYKITKLEDDLVIITGDDDGEKFFMLPFGVPNKDTLETLFREFTTMKAACEDLAGELTTQGLDVKEDRNNFDYLYLRDDLTNLPGRKYHKKRNKVRLFTKNYKPVIETLTSERIKDAVSVLDAWVAERDPAIGRGDYVAAKEALDHMADLKLCGAIYYVENKPVAYTTGEEMPLMETFVTHFEKGLNAYNGLMQFVNQDFATRLPEKYKFINREQDLGDAGLRQAKESYRPYGFVRKYRAKKK